MPLPRPRRRRLATVLAATACLGIGAGCGSSGSDAPTAAASSTTAAATPTTTASATPAAKPTSAQVILKDISFKPSTVRITAGGSVTWTWKDGDSPHNVTFDDRHSTTKHTGTYTLTFPTAGTFAYQCTIHPGMVAKVIVR